jgi:hypothetical protein
VLTLCITRLETLASASDWQRLRAGCRVGDTSSSRSLPLADRWAAVRHMLSGIRLILAIWIVRDPPCLSQH